MLQFEELNRNSKIFEYLFLKIDSEEYLWKPSENKWCLLEILCHLYDEEREDFRARIKHIFENPKLPMKSIDPVSWVKDRNYIQKDYVKVLKGLLNERKKSIEWLINLDNPEWNKFYIHPKLGKMSAHMILTNWVAHDYLHIKQIVKLKYDYLKIITGENLFYAGVW